MELAQQKNKQRYDKTTKEPEFFPTQRVWLYCTKVPVGKAPKLHRRWVGPYYITMVNRHNHTYKIRNCANNKEVKSLVSAHRLKPYYDPLTRPTNPPPKHANDNTQLDHDKVDLPGDQPADPRGRMQVPALPPRPTIPRQENNRKQQRQQPRQKKGNNNNQNRPENPPIVETRPSCKDCNRGTCTPFSEKMIDRLLASSRGNGTLYYKVKLTTGNSEWHFLCKIPSALVRQFHLTEP